MYALRNDELEDDDAHVLTLLAADDLLKTQRQHYGRKQLSSRTLAVMWCLRVYAILMVLVVIYSVVQVIHSAG